MKKTLKMLLLLIIFNYNLFSCTLCSAETPSVNVKIEKKVTQHNTTFNIHWIFEKGFTKQSLDSYPNKFDQKTKLIKIKNNLETYLVKNNYLTFITYDTNKTFTIDKLLKSTFNMKSNRFIYQYSFETNIKKEQNENIEIKFEDEGNFFLFHFNQENVIDKSQQNESKFISYLSEVLKEYTQKIKDLLDEINNSNSFLAYMWLFLFSFAYGVVHAIGPGHGKSLISSYFLSEKKSYLKALGMSSLIGVVHTFSAFILTFVIYYSVNLFLGNYFKNIETIATKISAVIIILIALYLIYKKIIRHKHQPSCACSGCKTHSTDLGVILAAGIVPCAGTVTIFIYTMSLNLYFIGFLSAIFMSLGMSLIIYITALLSIKIRDKSSSNTKLVKLFEYGSLVFILFLGIILFIV